MIRPQGNLLTLKTSSQVRARIATSLFTTSLFTVATSLFTVATSLFTVATSLVAVATSATPAFAAGSGTGGEGGHGSIFDLGWFWLNFIIYVSLLTFVLRKPLKNGWAARRARIGDEVSAATSDMEAAERELATVEALTKSIATEQALARTDILKQGELEAAALTENVREKSARITSQVKELLEGEARSAQASFRASLVAKAVELSKARFQSGDFASRQSAYVDAAIDRAKKLVS